MAKAGSYVSGASDAPLIGATIGEKIAKRVSCGATTRPWCRRAMA